MEEEIIQREKNKIQNKIQKIDYNHQLLELSVFENISDDDISLFDDVKKILLDYCVSNYSENNDLLKEYNLKKGKTEKLFQEKVSSAIHILNENSNSIKDFFLKEEKYQGYKNSLKRLNEFRINEEKFSDYYNKFKKIKQILEK
ncbi:MAG: hypothetical protein PHV16_00035 [Candidatus Nanoarchaeia archaeon]|nr:hypothetical protein [Candidatus Nanoarchaeia archaeon]